MPGAGHGKSGVSYLAKLACRRMAREAIPDGGDLAAGVAFLLDSKRMAATAKAASEWAKQAVQVVRGAAEPNPYKSADDEAIAKALLECIERRVPWRRGI